MLYKVLAATVILAILSVIIRRPRGSRGLPLPPGPKPRLFIGNLYDFPETYEWKTYAKWRQVYGDVIHLSAFGASTIVLNSSEAVTNLLEKRGSIYSDRPRLTMLRELIGWSWNLVLMPYGPLFAVHRRLVQQHFQPEVVAHSYQSIISEETRQSLINLANSPEQFAQHMKRTASAIIMRIAYGHYVPPSGDQFVKLASDVREMALVVGNPGHHIVDKFPFLKYVPDWFPGAHYKIQARNWRKLADGMRMRPFQLVKEQIAAGTAQPSLTYSLLENENTNTGEFDRDEIIMNTAGVLYSAAADTTASSLTGFFLAMISHPQVQKRAQAEIDSVTGRLRLPEFSDRPKMPYIDAMVKETLRWNPVTPLGVPHRVMQDDFYKGMYIPRGATVVANIWGILHDESSYKEPEKYIPERFLPNSGSTSDPDPFRVAFGFGRRICPGRYMADTSIWLGIAYILSVFDITPALDADGHEIVPHVEWCSGLVSTPSPFKCVIKPRWKGALDLV